MDCVVYRCAKQPELYLYLRAGLATESLPAPLLARTGRLTQVMRLGLTPTRKLARVDVKNVMERLVAEGFYLQLPPQGLVAAFLNDAD